MNEYKIEIKFTWVDATGEPQERNAECLSFESAEEELGSIERNYERAKVKAQQRAEDEAEEVTSEEVENALGK